MVSYRKTYRRGRGQRRGRGRGRTQRRGRGQRGGWNLQNEFSRIDN